MVRTHYAKALFELGLEHNCLKEIKENYDVFAASLKEKGNGKFFKLMKSYTLTNEKKKRILDAVCFKFNEVFLFYLYTLIDNKRFNYIFRNKIEFDKLYLHSFNVVPFDIFSAMPLTDVQLDKLTTILKAKFNADYVIINNFIDKSLLAGIKIKSYEKFYDISLKKQLTDLHSILQKG